MSAAENKAVFLSYASQDAEAARRICEALRVAGVEVWFDQSELRGGDAWDAKIRKQIKECALFVPIISATTQARLEGYFRLEWKLAAQRTHTMADAKPFLVPVCIDDTRDSDAHVPEEFRAVQWTRLPGGLLSAEFSQQVRRLLAPSGELATDVAGLAIGSAGAGLVRRRRRGAAWVVAGGVAIALGIAGWHWSGTSTGAPSRQSFPSDKSVAVLPFANLSPDAENAFFADGVHEEVLTNLQSIHALRVISRTSVMSYRASTKRAPEIARELDVAYVLEGSVRREQNAVRVTAKLVDARTDSPIWSPRPFNGDLSVKGVFAIQTEIAEAIAQALQAKLSPQEHTLLGQMPTENLEAYDLFVKARSAVMNNGVVGDNLSSEQLLRRAVELDPGFAVAWAWLGFSHASKYFLGRDKTSQRAAQAKAAIDTAVRLAPENPEVLHCLGRYYYFVFHDYTRAAEQYQRALELQPNNADLVHSIAAMHRRRGEWLESIAYDRRATRLDPANVSVPRNFIGTLEAGRRYREAKAERERMARFTSVPDDDYYRARLPFLVDGSTGEMERYLRGAGANDRRGRVTWAFYQDRPEEFFSVAADSYVEIATGAPRRIFAASILLAAHGDMAAARAKLPDLAAIRATVAAQPANSDALAQLACADALLGNREAAVRWAVAAQQATPEKVDAFMGPAYSEMLAFVHAWTGDKDDALAEYARLISLPGARLNVHVMRRSPEYAPLRGDPRFEALLNDPKNNAPLF